MNIETTLVLGGARSGKSSFAEKLVLKTGLKPIYVATGRALDDEMQQRIEHHQERRGDQWETVEEPLALVDALRQSSYEGNAILVDCLTLWITNLMMAEANVLKEADSLANFLTEAAVPIVLVSNETGLGIVPMDKMSREFCDFAGLVHQKIAASVKDVYFITAGLPQKLK